MTKFCTRLARFNEAQREGRRAEEIRLESRLQTRMRAPGRNEANQYTTPKLSSSPNNFAFNLIDTLSSSISFQRVRVSFFYIPLRQW